MEEKKIIGYKGFDRDLTCRGFQYEEGNIIEHKGIVEIRHSGFHICENPLDLLRYYFMDDLCELKRFFVVEGSGEIQRGYTNESICCVSKLRLLRELTIRKMLSTAVETHHSPFLSDYHDKVNVRYSYEKFSSHSYGAVISTLGTLCSVYVAGAKSSVCNFGKECKLFINSAQNQVYNEGSYSTIIITGDENILCNIGDHCVIFVYGEYNKIRNIGADCTVYRSSKSDINVFGNEKTIVVDI